MEDGLVRWTMQEARTLASDQFGSRDSGRIKEPLEVLATVISSPSNPASPGAVERKKNQNGASDSMSQSDDRGLVSLTTLEKTIAGTVRRSAPGCERFVGVIVRRTTPKSRFGANWTLRGVRFGKADREKANVAVTTIVERLQREFRVPDD
jgi:hypothetical protein